MIQKGNRQQGSPYFISETNSMKLERVPLDEKHFQENWLQKLIYNNPQVLPIDDIESGFAPLIPLGREITTPVGFIDNLYISLNGYLTIVETKLWRNPEAKREVVAQIIDYAKELKSWTFSDLNNAVISSNKLFNNNSKGIIDLIKEFDFVDENEQQIIIDNIDRNLKRGRLLLLIVGDGIRESVEDMVDYLSNSPQLQFTLAIVEIQVYKNPSSQNELIIIPNLITRTREIIRAIIKIEDSTNSNKISIETNFDEEKTKNQYTRTTITEDDFFDQLKQNVDKESVDFSWQILYDSKQKGYNIEWNQGSFSAKYYDPNGSGIKVTLYVTDRKGLFYIGYNSKQLLRLGLSNELSKEFTKRTAELISGLAPHPTHLGFWNRYSTLKEIKPVYYQFMHEVELLVTKIEAQLKLTAT